MRSLPSCLLLASTIWPFGLALAASCEPPRLVKVATPVEIRDFFASQKMRVVTFLGYSGAGYQDPAAMLRQASSLLKKQPTAETLVNVGATADGIGAVYAEAKRLGFRTSGIVSIQAKEQQAALSDCVDYVFYVTDTTWGGYLPDGKTLSPTSEAMVTASDELIAIGGGDVARDELLEARRRGRKVAYIPADLSHALARQKAARKGDPEPKDFRGSVYDAWFTK